MDLRISIVRDPHENDLPVGPLKHFRIVPVPNLSQYALFALVPFEFDGMDQQLI